MCVEASGDGGTKERGRRGGDVRDLGCTEADDGAIEANYADFSPA